MDGYNDLAFLTAVWQ